MFRKNFINVFSLDANKIIAEELPNLNWYYSNYSNNSALHKDVQWLFGAFIDNRYSLPIIEVDETTGDKITLQLTSHYRMMLDALDIFLMSKSDDEIIKYMKCSFTDSRYFGSFLKYAKASWLAGDKSLYGRYDVALDANGEVIGPYEFNGDTPVMLFESVNLQNMISEENLDKEYQLNDWWDKSLHEMREMAGKTVAVVCSMSAIDDLATTETVMQLFEHVGAKPYLCDLTDLNHDLLYLEKPFEINGVHERADAVFMLLPWEEMMATGNEVLLNWQSWHRNVKFFEPPWRWFMSNKGFFAFITHLLENDPDFVERHKDVNHIPTYLSDNDMVDFVRKPKIGRMGQNIEVRENGVDSTTEGVYGSEPCIYQPITPSCQIDGRTVIGTGWIAGDEAATIAFREFGGMITNIDDEQWIAHRVVANKFLK